MEKMQLERLFGMKSGLVLSFSDRTFQEFVADSVSRNIYDKRYMHGSGSKANRLRKFWDVESDHIVGKLVDDLVTYSKEPDETSANTELIHACRRIAQKLLQSTAIEDMEAFEDDTVERGFDSVVKSVKKSIEANEPETALDRLHTFVTKFLRLVCAENRIEAPKDKPLHSLLGEYVKALKSDGLIETQMTERILKSSIGNLEAFNAVRNDHSLAHDNPVLNYEESVLIVSHVTSAVKFIQALERKRKETVQNSEQPDDDLPF